MIESMIAVSSEATVDAVVVDAAAVVVVVDAAAVVVVVLDAAAVARVECVKETGPGWECCACPAVPSF